MVVVSPPRLKILAKAAKAEGTSVREQGVRNGNQRNLNPITCLQEEYVCEWKSDHVSSKNKYAICVEDDSGNFESKCVDAKLIKSGNYRSDTIAACGCCEVDTSGTSKGGFKDCLSILQTTKPDHCNEAEFTCQVGSREGKRRAGTSYCAKIAIGKGSTLTFGNSDECGDPYVYLCDPVHRKFI